MRKPLLFLKTLFIGFGVSVVVNAQQIPQTCGTDHIMEDLFNQQPALRELYNRQVQEVQRQIQLNGRNAVVPTVIEIPVVVHVFEDGNSAYYKTDQQIKEWLNQANAIFDGTANGVLSEANGGAKIPVRLVLAKRNPQNQLTSGILRYNFSGDATYVQYGVKYKNTDNGLDYHALTLDKQWDNNSYYNVYINNKFNGVDGYGGGLMGFAYYPGQSKDYSYMVSAVVKNTDTTFAHEMMHAFGIKHVFAADGNNPDDGNGNTCGGVVNDGIADTQRTKSLLNTWPVPTNNDFNDCAAENYNGVQHNIMNYGYTLNRFTPGQSDYAYQTIESLRGLMKTSLGAVPATNTNNIPNPIQNCEITGNDQSYYFYIKQVEFGSVIAKPGNVNEMYVDYSKNNNVNSGMYSIFNEGETFELKVSSDWNSSNRRKLAAYIDYNDNGIFETNEMVVSPTLVNSEATSATFSITIPNGTVKNKALRFRLVSGIDNIYDNYTDVTYGACDYRKSGQVMDFSILVKDNTTTWNGSSWSNGEPDGSKKVVVNGALELNTDIISKELTVNEGGSVIVKAGKTLNVTEKITNNSTADKFIVESGGHVIQMTNVINEGQFTVHRNSDLMVRNDMTFWSSPVIGQNVRSFSPETLENRFWTYREDTDLFSQLFTTEGENKPSSSYNFEPGKGVSIRSRNTLPTGQSEAFAGTFVGTLNNGDIFLPVLKMLNGYNLVGNPYPSSISSTQFINLNPNVSALYFWSHKYPVGHANYNLNYDSYTIAGPSSGDLSKIATGQGFIIKSDFNGMVHFSNILRNNSPAEFNRSTEIERNRIWLGLNKNEEPQNQILVAYMTNATNEFDHQIDGKRMQGGGTQLYTLLNNEAYAIQGRQLPFNTEDVVKLGLEVAEAGTLSISLNAIDGLFEEGQEVYILDKLTNSVHNLSTSAYQFNAEAGTFNERFEVLYTNRNLSTTDLKSDDIKVYKNGETFVVESSKSKIISVELVDVQGRKLFSESKLNTNRFEGYTAAKGVLIIKVATEDGQIKTQKIIK